MQLSRHFSQEQFEFSQTAERLNISNKMNSEQCSDAVLLCNNTLEPIFNKICNFSIDSGYRCPELNQKIGGVLKPISQHTEGKAADLLPRNMSLYDFMDRIRKSNIPFDQLILEFSWVHISYNGSQNRRQVLKALHSGSSTIYQNL